MRTQQEIAGFYRLALEMKLVGAETIIAWADSQILLAEAPDVHVIDLALTAGKPDDQLINALREVEGWPYHSAGSIQLLGALLWRQLNNGQRAALGVSKLIYSLRRLAFEDAFAVFGPSIYCVEDYFEPYMPDYNIGEAVVRRMLMPFANEILPPV
jgi:hypothetical protein